MPPDAPPLSALAARAHLAFMLSQSADVDDALQETLWIIVKRLGTLRDAPLVRAWGYRIATREALRLMRGSQRSDTKS